MNCLNILRKAIMAKYNKFIDFMDYANEMEYSRQISEEEAVEIMKYNQDIWAWRL